ncbi:MAG: DUF2127 domain-containing protein [Candidatus Paceibacterota bacterium]|jgi:uncharacterized membrane protein
MQPVISEKKIFRIFEISLWLKGLNALSEILGGIAVLLVNKAYIITLVLTLTQNELSDDPNDLVGLFIVNSVSSFAMSSQTFFSIYLLVHGILKVFVIAGLLMNRLWAYPASIVVFSGFIIYQSYRYYFIHSGWLLALTIFDIFIVYLVIHEYRVRRKTLHKVQ